jgi:hypothetical protein
MRKNGDWLFCRELPDYGQRIHWRNCYSAGNYQVMYEVINRRKGTFARNYQLRDEEPTGGIVFLWDLPDHGP